MTLVSNQWSINGENVSLSRISCCSGNSVVTSQTELGDVGPDLPGSTILPKTTGTFR